MLLLLIQPLDGFVDSIVKLFRACRYVVIGLHNILVTQFNGSPESDYFHAPPPPRVRHSRWKEDWEELELLVSLLCVSFQICDLLLFRAAEDLGQS